MQQFYAEPPMVMEPPEDHPTDLRAPLTNQHPIHGEFAKAYHNMGGPIGLTDWARENPTDFYKLLAKMAPTPKAVNHSGTVRIETALPENPAFDGEYTDVTPDADPADPTDPTA